MKRLWCRLFHREIFWPVNQEYYCKRCGLEYNNILKGETAWYEQRKFDYQNGSIDAGYWRELCESSRDSKERKWLD